MATTATTYGHEFSAGYQYNGILGYLNGGDYSEDDTAALGEALFDALANEVDNRLPDGVTWQPSTSEFIHPVDGDDLPDQAEMAALLETAWQAVVDQHDAIEAETLPVLQVAAVAAQLPDDPIERARVAGRVVDQARNAQERFANARRKAIYAATRVPGATYASVAEALGVSAAAINKAVTEFRALPPTVQRDAW